MCTLTWGPRWNCECHGASISSSPILICLKRSGYSLLLDMVTLVSNHRSLLLRTEVIFIKYTCSNISGSFLKNTQVLLQSMGFPSQLSQSGNWARDCTFLIHLRNIISFSQHPDSCRPRHSGFCSSHADRCSLQPPFL